MGSFHSSQVPKTTAIVDSSFALKDDCQLSSQSAILRNSHKKRRNTLNETHHRKRRSIFRSPNRKTSASVKYGRDQFHKFVEATAALFDTSPLPIIMLKLSGELVYYNSPILSLLSLPQQGELSSSRFASYASWSHPFLKSVMPASDSNGISHVHQNCILAFVSSVFPFKSEWGCCQGSNTHRERLTKFQDEYYMTKCQLANISQDDSYILLYPSRYNVNSKSFLIRDKLMKMSSIPILCADHRGVVQSFNPSAQKLFGFTEQEAVGRSMSSLLLESGGQPPFIRSFKNGDSIKAMETFGYAQRSDGHTIPVNVNIEDVDLGHEKYYIAFVEERKPCQECLSKPEPAANECPLTPEILDINGVSHKECSNGCVAFIDIKSFTKMSMSLKTTELMQLLNRIFSEFDRITELYNCVKIKTIGDAYMLCSGIEECECKGKASTSTPQRDIVRCVRHALNAIEKIDEEFSGILPFRLEVRAGIASGSLICGKIGNTRPQFDVNGSVVVLASRLESTGLPSAIQICNKTFQALDSDMKEMFERRDNVCIKGMGFIDSFITQPSLNSLHSITTPPSSSASTPSSHPSSPVYKTALVRKRTKA